MRVVLAKNGAFLSKMWRPVYRQSTFLVQRFKSVASLAATPKKMQKAGGIFESCPTFKSRRNVPTLHFFHLAMEEKRFDRNMY